MKSRTGNISVQGMQIHKSLNEEVVKRKRRDTFVYPENDDADGFDGRPLLNSPSRSVEVSVNLYNCD